MSEEIDYTVGSGNVFADLGVRDPETALAKAKVAGRIAAVIERRGWTQQQAATVLGLDQPKVSLILRGRLRDFSLERLIGFLPRLDQDVAIVVRANPEPNRAARMEVSFDDEPMAAGPNASGERVSVT